METGKRGWFPGSLIFGKFKENVAVRLIPIKPDGSADEEHEFELDREVSEIRIFDNLRINPKRASDTVVKLDYLYEIQLGEENDILNRIHYYVRGAAIKSSSLTYKGENNWKDQHLRTISQTI